MGKMFLYGKTFDLNISDLFSKLTVHSPIEAIVRAASVDSSVVYDVKTDVNGKAVFNRMIPGYWDITLADIENTPTKRVEIDKLDHTLDLNMFTATVDIEYPANSVCKVAYAGKTYYAPDTSGSWTCTVYDPCELTVTCTNGEQTTSSEVSVVSNGQSIPVKLKYFEATINITYTEGCICTCSYGNRTYTAPDTTGTWMCTVPSAGTWVITIIDDYRSKSTTVTITTDGQVVTSRLTMFEAYITVTYPAGSTCICYSDDYTYTAPNTSGSYTFTIPSTGEWTVECHNGSGDTDSNVVQITTDGQSKSVELYYDVCLFEYERDYQTFTGGWIATNTRSTASGTAKAPTTTISNVIDISMTSTSSYTTYRGSVIIKNNYLNLTDYSKLVVETTGTTTGVISIIFATTNTDGYGNNKVASLNLQNTSAGTHTLDLTSVNRNCYFFISVETNSSNRNASTKISKVYLER